MQYCGTGRAAKPSGYGNPRQNCRVHCHGGGDIKRGAAVILSAVQPILDYARELMGEGGMASYGEVALRALGIALLTHICACICRDCGENTIATMTEVGGKVAILLLCLPLLREIVQGISEFI